MEHIGIDVHKRDCQICILTEQGEIIEQRIRTERERLAAVLGQRERAKILIEASTESEWVARCLEGLGHEVIVADPNFAAMYATRSRKVKTDKRDVRTLAEACQLGAYRKAHRTSDKRRHLRAQLAVREALDDAKRFRGAHQVEVYLGLVPMERSSGEKQRKGSITKAGNRRVRWLLVQAAVSVLRLGKPETAALRDWAIGIAVRRGRAVAVVALARRGARTGDEAGLGRVPRRGEGSAREGRLRWSGMARTTREAVM